MPHAGEDFTPQDAELQDALYAAGHPLSRYGHLTPRPSQTLTPRPSAAVDDGDGGPDADPNPSPDGAPMRLTAAFLLDAGLARAAPPVRAARAFSGPLPRTPLR